METDEMADYAMAHRFSEHAAIFRAVDADAVRRGITRDGDAREWNDCLTLFGCAACDARGVILPMQGLTA